MARQIDGIRRMLLIINKIYATNGQYGDSCVSVHELLNYINDHVDAPISERTLQRDINDIEMLFHIEISFDRATNSYRINERFSSREDRLSEMLLNFELLNAVDESPNTRSYILPEHHRAVFSKYMPQLMYAVRNQHTISFQYVLYRHGGEVITKENILPHYIKESNQLWYVLAYDADGYQLKAYGIDRIRNLVVHDTLFERNVDIDVNGMYRDCYGIWNDESLPVEEVILQYDNRDGYFLKAMPLHHTQRVLVDDGKMFKISVHVKITNDFVMALLSRSRSLEVIAPMHLRKRMMDVYREALVRNSVPNDMFNNNNVESNK